MRGETSTTAAREVREKPGEMHAMFCYHALGICTPKAL